MINSFLFFEPGKIMKLHLTAQSLWRQFANQMNHIYQNVFKNKTITGLFSDNDFIILEPNYFNRQQLCVQEYVANVVFVFLPKSFKK